MADRILIYGVTGSGKSTLAAAVARRTGLPWHDVDSLTWMPGWTSVPEDEQRRRFTEICATDRWVLDTAYRTWRDVALARADLIVALDYPRWVSLSRLLRRTVARIVDHRPICNDNVETWRQALGPDSIVRWHFATFREKRHQIRDWAADPAMNVMRLTSSRRTEAWLAKLR